MAQSHALPIHLAPEPEATDVMPPARDRTSLPNWFLPIIFVAFFTLIGFVYATVDRRIEDKGREVEKLEHRLELQETYMKNTREQLIAHGWTVDEQGNIRPPKEIDNASTHRR
jgi:hypothetical protein